MKLIAVVLAALMWFAADAAWLAFLNLEKGYGYGFVMLDYKASRSANPGTGVSDGAENGKYWSRKSSSGNQNRSSLATASKNAPHTFCSVARKMSRCASSLSGKSKSTASSARPESNEVRSPSFWRKAR